MDDTSWYRDIAENARRYQELQNRTAQLSITETSRDGTVAVTVSATGLLTGLVLDDRRQVEPLSKVGERIMACMRRAQARIPGLLAIAMQETIGTQDPATQELLAVARQRFPAPPPEFARHTHPVHSITPVTPQPEVVRRSVPAPTSVADDDWSDATIMEDVE